MAQPAAPGEGPVCPLMTVLGSGRTHLEPAGTPSSGQALLSDLDEALRAIKNRYPASLQGALEDALGQIRELESLDDVSLPVPEPMQHCAAVEPELRPPDGSVVIAAQYLLVELDFGDQLPGVTPRRRRAADPDWRARGSEWAPATIVTGAVRFDVVALSSLLNDVEQAAQSARGRHPRWEVAAAAVRRARSSVQRVIRTYDAPLVRALCELAAARRGWQTDQSAGRKLLLDAASRLGDGLELGDLQATLRRLAKDPAAAGSTILQAEERLHGLLRSRACATPPAADR